MSRQSRLDATDRVNLLLSFVPYLIDHSPVSVTDLSRVFDTSAESVRELIRLLAVSGVPGDSGMYQHQDLFDIDWDAFENDDEVVLWNHIAVEATPRLSQLEAASLIAGLQYVSGLAEGSDSAAVNHLITKLSRGANAEPQTITVSAGVIPPAVSLINLAIAHNHAVEFVYLSRDDTELRRVDPIRLDLVGQQWYLRGWCHLRGALRTFRLSRMRDLLETSVVRTADIAPRDLPDELFELSAALVTVSCTVPGHSFNLVSEFQPTNVRVSDDDVVTLDIQLGTYDTVISLVAGTSGALQVTSPHEAKHVLHEWARQAVQYQLDTEPTA